MTALQQHATWPLFIIFLFSVHWFGVWLKTSGQVTSLEGYRLYTAMYEFAARSDDELSLLPGDLIWINSENIGTGTGWSVGRTADGREGCFPESYVQPTDDTACGEAILQQTSGTSDTVDSAIAPPATDAPTYSGQYQPGSEVVWVEAIYPWNAKKDNHLSFSKGDQIAVYEQQDVWWSGELNGKIGWFPRSYVNVTSSSPKRTEDIEGDASTVAQSDTSDKMLESAELYVAVYAYTSSEDGDLNFNENDVISVTRSEGDWWSGTLGNKSGIFPANFVKKMEAQPPAAVKEEDGPKATPSKKPEIGTVIAPYEPTSADQLALQVGQMIQIRRKTDSGWWEGELQVRGQKRRIGWFPANFVKVLGPGGSRLSAEASGKIPTQPPQTAAASSTTSIQGTSTDGSSVGKVLEQAIALFDYQSQQSDELGFVKGNVINVLSKEHSDWWMGELNGQTGIFPANFVGPLS